MTWKGACASDGWRYHIGVYCFPDEPAWATQERIRKAEAELWAKAMVSQESNRIVWSTLENHDAYPGTVMLGELVSLAWFARIERRRAMPLGLGLRPLEVAR